MSDWQLLNEHEEKVMVLLLGLEGVVQGFPDSKRKLYNAVHAWASFISLDQYHVSFDPQIEPYMSDEDKAPYMWKEGVVPGEWLIEQVRNSCEWMPAPVSAREIYCAHFTPLDGITMDKLQVIGRKNIRPEE